MSRSGHIYFITDAPRGEIAMRGLYNKRGEWVYKPSIKIGKTINIRERLRKLNNEQGTNCCKYYILHLIGVDDIDSAESKFHDLFKTKRITGEKKTEWFWFDMLDIANIKLMVEIVVAEYDNWEIVKYPEIYLGDITCDTIKSKYKSCHLCLCDGYEGKNIKSWNKNRVKIIVGSGDCIGTILDRKYQYGGNEKNPSNYTSTDIAYDINNGLIMIV